MTLRLLRTLLVVCVFSGTVWAATDPLTGTWKLNPAKSHLTDVMRVKAAGDRSFTFFLSATNPETIVVNGTDQPGIFGTTLAVTELAPHQWKVVRKKDGHLLISAIWELSADGNTLTDHFTGYRADGSTNNLLYVYARTEPGAGFAGTWESTSEQVNSTYEIQVEPYGDAGLSFATPAQKMTRRIKFDGKDYAGEGPNLPAGYTTSGRRLTERTVELTDKIDGKVLDTQLVEATPGGETLTITTHLPGVSKPNVQVFERE